LKLSEEFCLGFFIGIFVLRNVHGFAYMLRLTPPPFNPTETIYFSAVIIGTIYALKKECIPCFKEYLSDLKNKFGLGQFPETEKDDLIFEY